MSFAGLRVVRMITVCLALLSVLAGTAARADRIELVSRALPEQVSETAGTGSTLLATSADARWVVFGIDPEDVTAINQDDSYEGVYYTVTPCRLVDTQVPGYGPALQNNQVALVEVFGACGVPPTARAVAMNLSFSGAGQRGNILVFPGDLAQPPLDEYLWIEAGNFTRSLSAIMPLGADGTVAILPRLKAPKLNPTVHIALDVTGYFE